MLATIISDMKTYWFAAWEQAVLAGAVCSMLYLGYKIHFRRLKLSDRRLKLSDRRLKLSDRRQAGRTVIDLCISFLTGAYGYFLVYITLIMRSLGSRWEVNLIPFAGIDVHRADIRFVIENILLFIPFGLLLPLCFNGLRRFYRIISLAVLTSMGIEMIQYILKNGKTETDDVMMNVFGTLIGYSIFCGLLQRSCNQYEVRFPYKHERREGK